MRTNVLHTLNEAINASRVQGIYQLVTEDDFYDGRHVTIKGQQLINFGNCSYLGLEVDDRLKQGAIDAIQKYGIQFSSSRFYLACTLYSELETLIRKIFNAPVALSTSVSLGHHGVIPVVINDNDAIILDQQVHSSVQDAALKMQAKGVKVTIVRHNDMDELRRKVEELSIHYDKVWYLIDGVYSMYGDFAPVDTIVEFLNTYKKFHVYADDAHGMSWCGKNGKGYILSKTDLHPKMIIATSLNKAFAAGGGAFIFSDEDLCQRVKNCGGSFMFSGPHQIPVLGAAIASAKIHLSDEIYFRQEALQQRISYCHQLLKSYDLPVISASETPIFFVGMGLLRVGQNMVKKMLDAGFYINISAFPAVPESCTGIRFTITLHHRLEDIKRLVDAIAVNFRKVLQEEERSIQDIHRAFRRVASFSLSNKSFQRNDPIHKSEFLVSQYRSINQISKDLWNGLMQGKGNFDWNALKIMEQVFSHNPVPENNWKFHYYIIHDIDGNPILATFFTIALTKDDMLAPLSVSDQLEKARTKNKYYLTSKTMMMGSLITEGDHLFIDKSFSNWKKALMTLVDECWKQQDKHKAGSLLFRDFNPADKEICEFFKEQGFITYDMPDTHCIEDNQWTNSDHYLSLLKHDKRYYLRKRVFKLEDQFEIKITNKPSDHEIEELYKLYENISRKNLEINVFPLPKKLFTKMAESGDYEFISLFIKSEREEAVGMAINYSMNEKYYFLFTGMDYSLSEKYDVYPQLLWQIVKRANELNLKLVHLGFTASQNKRKFGARPIAKVAFIQMKDNFNMHLMEIMKKAVVSFK